MSKNPETADDSTVSFITGLAILLVAQLLSAIMGIYVQETYAAYGAHWHENLFYSHLLSLPLFIPFFPSLFAQFSRLITSEPFVLSMRVPDYRMLDISHLELGDLSSIWDKYSKIVSMRIPIQLFMLAINSLTQYACIRGVNLLGARTSALGVTVVLNLRKLVSLFASIWLFGNRLPLGVTLGATIVFAGAGVYALEDSRVKKSATRAKTKSR